MKKGSSYTLIMLILILAGCKTGNNEKDVKEVVVPDVVPTVALPVNTGFDTVINGKKSSLYYLQNKKNLKAAITNYGARVVGLLMPDKEGKLTDVVLGFSSTAAYMHPSAQYFGTIVGRYGNRIAKGKFRLDGKEYQLDINNKPNSLHGGSTGFHSRIWDAVQRDSSSVELTYVSADGEEGYPGTVTAKVIYTLTDNDELRIDYEISTDKKTVVNLTNHNFYNLNGEGKGTINNHDLTIHASRFTPVDSTLIPMGIAPVAGTPFDFLQPHKIGERLEQDHVQLKNGNGYDHNFVLNKTDTGGPSLAATVKGDLSGIVMEIYTTEPGIQLYGGNFMRSGVTLKSGAKDDYRTAFCLETQHFPDSPNQPSFPSTVLEPGKIYKSSTVHKFYTAGK